MATPPSTPSALPAARGPDAPEVLERFHAQLELVYIVARQVAKTLGPVVEISPKAPVAPTRRSIANPSSSVELSAQVSVSVAAIATAWQVRTVRINDAAMTMQRAVVPERFT